MVALANDYDVEYDGALLADGDTRQIINLRVFDTPDIRTSDQPRGQIDGEMPGIDLYGGRTIEADIEVWSSDPTEFRESYMELLAICRKRAEEKVLRFSLPGWSDLRVNARPRRLAGLHQNVGFDLGVATVKVQFKCTDPRIYSDELHTDTAILAASSSGATFPLTAPITFGPATTSGSALVVNDGSYDAPWRATIVGPVTNPRIENLTQGKIMSFVGDVADGQTLVVISHPTPSVLLNGTASRYNWLQDPSTWFMLEPGQNEIRLTGSSAGVPVMTIEWRHAWV